MERREVVRKGSVEGRGDGLGRRDCRGLRSRLTIF